MSGSLEKSSLGPKLGFFLGPVFALIAYWILPEGFRTIDGERVSIGPEMRVVFGLTAWMAVWWLSEAIPLAATALLPLVILPLFGVEKIHATAANYGHELIFLFMGGFLLSKGMQRWGLHQRIALLTLRWFGHGPRTIVGGFMVVCALLSMWVSNTATAIMMLPIAASVLAMLETRDPGGIVGQESATSNDGFATALMLGLAYACSIGGVATLIGSPPNLFLASFIRERLGMEVTFLQWFLIGFPLVCVFLPLTWWLLTRVMFRVDSRPIEGGRALFFEKFRALGPINRGSKATFLIFSLTAVLWLTRPYLVPIVIGGAKPFAGLTDAGIAILAGILLFATPVDFGKRVFVLDWETAVTLPWGILILFGGGLSLASVISKSGLGAFFGAAVSEYGFLPSWLLLIIVCTMIIFLTELTSNTATTATMVPILCAMALGLGKDPFPFIFATALAASFAFMMPVATPPNAIVFASGKVTMNQMARAGLILNLLGVLVLFLVCYFLVGLVVTFVP